MFEGVLNRPLWYQTSLQMRLAQFTGESLQMRLAQFTGHMKKAKRL